MFSSKTEIKYDTSVVSCISFNQSFTRKILAVLQKLNYNFFDQTKLYYLIFLVYFFILKQNEKFNY